MIEAGELGGIRVVQVEYAQDWLTTPLEQTGQKQAVWRTDPAQSGPAGSLGDIGTHAYNLACFATGLRCDQSRRRFHFFFRPMPGRRLDDNVQMLLRFDGARAECCGPVRWPREREQSAVTGLWGEAGIEWGRRIRLFAVYSVWKTPVTISRLGLGRRRPRSTRAAFHLGIPRDIGGFAQLYADLAEQSPHGTRLAPAALVATGAELKTRAGVRFIS